MDGTDDLLHTIRIQLHVVHNLTCCVDRGWGEGQGQGQGQGQGLELELVGTVDQKGAFGQGVIVSESEL